MCGDTNPLDFASATLVLTFSSWESIVVLIYLISYVGLRIVRSICVGLARMQGIGLGIGLAKEGTKEGIRSPEP
jgi:hypothetical protein